MNITYAGVGARKTPTRVLSQMREYARLQALQGSTLRSGGAIGADQAFYKGFIEAQEDGELGHAEIFLASCCTPEAEEHASRYHPRWRGCSAYVRKLHGRNSMIVLGADLNSPVDLMICWTQFGETVGGTGQAIRVAEDAGIDIINLGIRMECERLAETIRQMKEAVK